MERSDIIKLKVLHYSLTLEKLASVSLGAVLDIEDVNSSKSLGNTSESLSFNQKVNLLIDFGAVEKEEKKILDTAMRLRNQFMHNIDCETYQDAFNHLDGEERKLRKTYTDLFKNDDNEKNLDEATNRVFRDSFKIVGTIKGNLEKKLHNAGRSEMRKQLVDSYENTIKAKFDEVFDEISNDELKDYDKEKLLKRIMKLYEDVYLGSVRNVHEQFEK